MGGDWPTLLHLTDLHFGYDTSPNDVAARDLALRGLLTVLSRLESDWKPSVVCVSGNIGWKGHAGDYNAARNWLTELLVSLSLSAERVALCPGNHDIDRNVSQKYARPKDGAEADRILAVPIAPVYEDAFRAFAQFAHSFGIPAYRLGDHESYLAGQRSIEGISLCALNSAWFCQGADDQGSLWIGRPHIDLLEHHGLLSPPGETDRWEPTIVLLHHPREWLHDEEIHARGGRPNTFDVIARRCHLLLSGHAHGESRRADRCAESAWHLNGGATYAGSDYQNGFTIVRTEEDRFIYRTFEYDPRSADREWRQTIEATELPFRKGAERRLIPSPEGIGQRIERWRTAAAIHAQGVIEAKSRALRPWGVLPKTLPLCVLIQTSGARPRFSPFGQLEPQEKTVSVPLLQATRTGRRTLLLGDLGSGKSTISARYVIDSQNATPGSLAIYVPAKSIAIDAGPRLPWTTITDFLRAVSSYFSGQVCPQEPGFGLESLLESRVEIALIIDGLDEVHPRVAQSILQHLACIVDHWPTTQVLATGRPVELAGVDYAKWQLCTPATLTDGERLNFFVEEALADGKPFEDAKLIATVALERLRGLPDLNSLATTPLFCRLLLKQLGSRPPGKAPTLGDLLYELIRERLADWASQDLKTSQTPLFDAVYPDADSRAGLLSKLALRLHGRQDVRIEEARLHLDVLLPTVAAGSKPSLIDEALRSFENSGLVILDGGFQFPLRPFEELCCGYPYAVVTNGKDQGLMQADPSEWRIVSFAATMARRLGTTDGIRDALRSYLQQLLQASGNVPAASYVVSEFQDHTLAISYIDQLKTLGSRPLWFPLRAQDWQQSAHAIADSIGLAGDVGFGWFFAEYLDPRYPFVFAGSKLTEEVFEQWAALHLGHLSERQKSNLRSLVQPHMAAASHQVISIVPLLTALTPEAFGTNDRLWFCARLLDKPQFRESAQDQIREAMRNGNSDLVSNVLLDAAAAGYDYAAVLHLSLFDGRPPLGAVRSLVKPGRGHPYENESRKGMEALVARLGLDCLTRFLRWFLFDADTMLAAGAALELYRLGERRLPLVGPVLLRALHDGGYVQAAEEALACVVRESGPKGTHWLALSISRAYEDMDGAHSGWWRILFNVIRGAGRDAPRLLAQCTAGIGQFLLARYPEVRQGFRELLTGPDAAAFRGALHDYLGHPDPAVRHGAAMVLVTCDPMNEGRALEEVVRSKSRLRYGAWHEWERFCLSLKFGPSVISHLQTTIGSFPAEAEWFALSILYRNGVALDAPQFKRLVNGELTWGLSIDESDEVLRSQNAFDLLLEIAEGESQQLAPRAAEKLLECFAERLTPEQRARSIALTVNGSSWRRPDFQAELLRMEQDPAYAKLFKQASVKLVQQGFPRPVIDLLYEAGNDASVWESIIWNELCAGALSLDVGTHGQWILDLCVSALGKHVEWGGPLANFCLTHVCNKVGSTIRSRGLRCSLTRAESCPKPNSSR
jgi:calcineurin-like phosphoesterase family protein